jgi:hypothetical protein
MRGCFKLRQAAIYCTLWGNGLGRVYGPVVRQTVNRMNEDRKTVNVECERKAIPIITEELEPSQCYSENC